MPEPGVQKIVGLRQPSADSSWALRLVVMTLLVVSYFTLWQPARNGWGPRLVYPTLSEIAKNRADVSVSVTGRVVRISPVQTGTKSRSYTLAPPAGVRFLLPALFILAIAPRRWGWFFAGHILLSVVITCAFAGFAEGSPALGYLGRGIQAYVVDAYSLGYPILMYIKCIDTVDV
jgi:hypothetical protein